MFAGWSRLRKLSWIWWALEVAFLAVAGVLLGVSTVWREQDTLNLDKHTLRRLTIKTEFLNSKSDCRVPIPTQASTRARQRARPRNPR